MATASVPEDTINPQTSTQSWDVVYTDVFGVARESGQLHVTTDNSIVFSCNKEKPVHFQTLRWVSSESNDPTGCEHVTISFYNTETDTYDYIFFTVEKSSALQCLAELQRLVLLKFDASHADAEYVQHVVPAIKAQPFYKNRIEVSIQDSDSKSSDAEDQYSDYMVVADMECLTLFSKSHPQPVHRLLFWITESPNTVEEVRLCNNQIVVASTGTKEFKFKADDEFLLKIRMLTPKKEHLYTDCESMIVEFGQKKPPQQQQLSAQRSTGDREAMMLEFGQIMPPQRQQQLARRRSSPIYIENSQADRLQSELEAAISTFSQNEDMQNYWISVEFDINELIKNGHVPETDHMSGGLNPESAEHLERCLSDIEDQFKENNIPVAVSRLRACREQFKHSTVRGITSLFCKDDMWLLKALYMKSLQN